MNIEETRIVSTEPAWEGAFITWFHASGAYQRVEAGPVRDGPLRAEGANPMFARAFSYYRIDGDRFALLYAAIGRGTRWLSEQPPAIPVRMYGPLGNGLRFPNRPANCSLLAAAWASRR